MGVVGIEFQRESSERERERENIDTFRIVVHLLQRYIFRINFHTIIYIVCVERERSSVRT